MVLGPIFLVLGPIFYWPEKGSIWGRKASKVMKIGAISGPKQATKGARFGVVFEAKSKPPPLVVIIRKC